jgi:hypothetical protein
MKRVKLTEGQVRMIRLLEDGGQLDQFSSATKRVETMIDGMWNKISFLSIGDLDGQADTFEEYADQLMRLDSTLHGISNKKEELLANIERTKGNDAMMEFDSYVDGLVYDVQIKLNSLEVFLDSLIPLSKAVSKTKKLFPEPTDITQ